MMMMKFGYIFILICWCCISQYMSDKTSCQVTLYDEQTKFMATSVLDNKPEYQPHNVKSYSLSSNEISSKAWCPQTNITEKRKEWIVLDFVELKYLKMLVICGLNRGNFGKFARNIYFEYQRSEDLTNEWYSYRKPAQIEKKLLKANNDYYYLNFVNIKTPLVIRRIRITPIELKPQPSAVCLKLGVFGCAYNDAIKEYQMQQGDISNDKNFYDKSYDGNRVLQSRALLTGGLGCLTDDLYDDASGNNSFHTCVAWKRKLNENYIDITFIFPSLRQFNYILIYPVKDNILSIEPMNKLEIHFNVTNNSSPLKNKRIEFANFTRHNPIKLDLEHNISDMIILRLYFKNDWMGLSEVKFDSTVYILPNTSMITPNPSPIHNFDFTYLTIGLLVVGTVIVFAVIVSVGSMFFLEWSKRHKRFKFSKMWLSHNASTNNTTGNSFPLNYSASQSMHHLIPSTSTTKFIPTLSGSTSNPNNLGRGVLPYGFDPINHVPLRYPTNYSHQPNNNNYLTTLLPTHMEPIRVSPTIPLPANDYEEFDTNIIKANFNKKEIDKHPFQRTNYNNEQSDLVNSLSSYPPPPPPSFPPTNPYTNNTTDSSYSSIHYSRPTSEVNSIAAPDLITVPSIISMNESTITNNTSNNNTNFNSKFPHKSIQGVFGSTMTLLDQFDGSRRLLNEENITEACPNIHSSSIQLTETLVEGRLGSKVAGYYAVSIDEILDESGIGLGHSLCAKEQRVLVMKPNCSFSSANDRIEYYREISYLLQSKSSPTDFDSNEPSKPVVLHQNLPSIIGSIIFDETTESEDIRALVLMVPNNSNNLVNFFQKIRRQPTPSANFGPNFMCNFISHTSLLYMAQQLANCMHYLTTELGLVHRDLAARNIYVSDGFQIVLHDSAIGAEEFSNHYEWLPMLTNQNQTGICKLPIRWMAWEAITMSSYSPKSDVWSFGVVLWEMLTECQIIPFSCFPIAEDKSQPSTQLLLHNSTLIANNHPASILPNCRSLEMTATHLSLAQENNQFDSGKAIQQLIGHCWTPDPSMRPTFNQLNESLLRLYQLVGISTNKKSKNNSRPHSYQLYKQPDDYTKSAANL